MKLISPSKELVAPAIVGSLSSILLAFAGETSLCAQGGCKAIQFDSWSTVGPIPIWFAGLTFCLALVTPGATTYAVKALPIAALIGIAMAYRAIFALHIACPFCLLTCGSILAAWVADYGKSRNLIGLSPIVLGVSFFVVYFLSGPFAPASLRRPDFNEEVIRKNAFSPMHAYEPGVIVKGAPVRLEVFINPVCESCRPLASKMTYEGLQHTGWTVRLHFVPLDSSNFQKLLTQLCYEAQLRGRLFALLHLIARSIAQDEAALLALAKSAGVPIPTLEAKQRASEDLEYIRESMVRETPTILCLSGGQVFGIPESIFIQRI